MQFAVRIKPDLLTACQAGDRSAFNELFEAYRDRVYSVVRHLVAAEAAAKDVTQQVFLTVWCEIGHFRGEAEFSTWLYRVAVNASLDERKRQGRFSDCEPPEQSASGHQEEAVLARQLQAALARLPPRLAAPLVLRHVEGLSYDEIASVLDCSPGTVASRLNRAHQALAATIGRDGRKEP